MNYDVFLSYHSRDHAHVEAIARALREDAKLNVFLDRWYLPRGTPWPQELERVLAGCGAVAVCIGPGGEMGPWQQREVNAALSRQVRDKRFPVIPVLLPQSDPVLGFLGQNTWVDLRARADDPTQLAILAKAIRGEPPGADIADQVRATLATICPYRGLLYFREEDRDFFFGRDSAIAELEQALGRGNFVSVVGASGSGKSSVVRAGLIPKLRAARERPWEIVTLVPGSRPLHSLSAALMPLLEADMSETDRLLEVNKQVQALQEGRLTLRDIVERVLAKQSGTERILIFVDQWEELYTQTTDEVARKGFIDELLHACAANPAIHVVLTIRGDFIGHAFGYGPLVDRWKDAQVSIGPMKREELERAIVEPARKVALSFAPTLVPRILHDVGGEPGNLPLLEFVLKQLWEKCCPKEMSHEAYEAMGQLRGAIAAKADKVYEALSESDRQALQRVFVQLVRPAGDNALDTRRRAALEDIGPASLPLVRKLADQEHRLLITGKDSASGADTVEVSHEALIRHWQKLKDWLAADREFLLWRERFRAALAEWETKARDERLLLREPLLSEAQSWVAKQGGQLGEKERSFFQASLVLRTNEQQAEHDRQEREIALERERTRRSRNHAIWAVVLAAISLSALVWSIYSRQQAEVAKMTAQARARDALARQLLAKSEQLFASGDFDRSALVALAAHEVSQLPEVRERIRWLNVHLNFRTRLRGHTGSVTSAQFSPDGKTVVTASQDKTARLWEAASGKELAVLRGHQGYVTSTQFSPDGRTVVTASNDKTARLWDAKSGKELVVLRGHEEKVTGAQFSPNGKMVVTASEDKTARLWEVASGKELSQLRGHTGSVTSAQFSPDGSTVVTASADKMMRWEVASGKALGEFKKSWIYRARFEWTSEVTSLQFSSDGNAVVSASWDGTARLWEAATGKERAGLREHEGWVTSARFSLDGKTVVTASSDKTARLWEVDGGKAHGVLRGHENVLTSAQFSPDGKTVVTASYDNTAMLWDASIGEEPKTLEGHEKSLTSAQFSLDGKMIATSSRDGTARIWDAASGKALVVLRGHDISILLNHDRLKSNDQKGASDDTDRRTIALEEAMRAALSEGRTVTTPADIDRAELLAEGTIVNTVQFSPNGKIVITVNNDATARLWETTSGKELIVLHGVGGVQFSPDGKTVVTTAWDGTAKLREAASGKELTMLHGHAWRPQFSPDGKTVVAAGSDNTARLWEAASGKELVVLRGHQGDVTSAQFSPDGKTVVTASNDKTARLWDAKSGKELVVLRGHEGKVFGARFSSDASKVVTESVDKSVRLWESRSGKERVVLRGFQEQSAHFSPDGETLLTTGGGYAWLWDTATGKELGVLPRVSGAQFSPDGKTVLTVSNDNTARLWRCTVCGSAEEAAASLAKKIGSELTAEERRQFGVPDDLVTQ